MSKNNQDKANIGMIGLGVMGARNIERNGYSIAVFQAP